MFTKNQNPLKQIGYGAMGLEGYYGQSDDSSAINTLIHAIENNMMIDTADAYGNGHNEKLIKKANEQTQKQAFIATKFGIVFEEGQSGTKVDTGWGFPLHINGSKSYIKQAIDNSLKRLGIEQIDLLYAHYLDPNTPLAETISTMAEAVKEGKVKYIGLSNITDKEILEAHKIHPITAVQYEYSLFRREAETHILPILNKIGAKLVCWSPLGAGFLTGTLQKIPEGDFRNNNPKMQGENFQNNLKRLEQIKEIAANLNISPAQLALAWLLAQGNHIIPIPGSRKISRIDENLRSLNISLTDETLKKLDKIAPIGSFKGATLI